MVSVLHTDDLLAHVLGRLAAAFACTCKRPGRILLTGPLVFTRPNPLAAAWVRPRVATLPAEPMEEVDMLS